MFDLYEHNLRQELGEDEAGVATLRQKLTWVDGAKKTVGFGEKHPTAENTIDGTRSQADRRVEVMLFDAGEEPNLAGGSGEEIYDANVFERRNVEPMKTARRNHIFLLDSGGNLLAGATCRILTGELSGSTFVADETGAVALPHDCVGPNRFTIEWNHPAFPDAFVYSCAVVLDVSFGDADEVRAKAIHQNLGYLEGTSLEVAVKAFQSDYRVDADPMPLGLTDAHIPEGTMHRLDGIHRDPRTAMKP